MRLFYCMNCGHVVAFNVYDINKHGLTKPRDTTCQVCQSPNTFLMLPLKDLMS